MTRNENLFDVAIVGGGAAGLTAAWHLRDKRIILLEQSDRVGGRMRSESRGQYWINLGCHLFPGAGSNLHRLIDDLGLHTLDIPGIKSALAVNGHVYAARRVESYPFRLPLNLRERGALIVAGLKLRRAVKGYYANASTRPDDQEQQRRARINAYRSNESAQDLLGALPVRVQELLTAAGERAASELDEQSAGVIASLFASVWGGKRAFANLNIAGGSGRLPEAVAGQLGSRILLNATVSQVKGTVDGDVEVSYSEASGEQTLVARQVIVAVPAPHARRIVADLPTQLDRCLADVQYGPFVCMGIVTTETTDMPWANIYALTTPGLSFNMLFNHGNVVSREPGTAGGSLMVYAGGKAAWQLLELDDDQIRTRFCDDLLQLYPQLEHLMGESIVRRWDLGNTYRQPGFDVTPLLTYSKRRDVDVHFAGDYFAELGNVEQAATAGLEAARRVRQVLESDRRERL